MRGIADPEERLRMLIRLHIEVVLSVRDREITVMLHENHPLPPALRKRINARKKDYMHFVEGVIAEVQRRGIEGSVSPRAAAFALLGMINWIYQWYKPEGTLRERRFGAAVHGDIFCRSVLLTQGQNMNQPGEFFQIDHCEQHGRRPEARTWSFCAFPALSAGVYVLPAGGADPQKPHREDEMYYVVRGRARMRVGSADQEIRQGSVIFVAAGWTIVSTTSPRSLWSWCSLLPRRPS